MAGDHIIPWQHYAKNFAALTVLMVLTVWIAQYNFSTPGLNLLFALSIAITKASLIILIFMNVKWCSHLTWIFAGAGFFWFLILIGFILTDFIIVEHFPPIP